MNDPTVAAAMLSAARGSQRKSTPNGRTFVGAYESDMGLWSTDVAIAFLLGPDAVFVTGEALNINGGAFMD